MTDAASPIASPVRDSAAPYGIGAVRTLIGLSSADVADELFFLHDEIAGLPQRQVTSDSSSATVIYAIDEGVPVPRFGMIVAVQVTPSTDADTLIANLERDRWGDPKDHTITASGSGSASEPAFREFSRTFPPGMFLLPNRPVYFLLWYRANDDFAFMVMGDNPAVREGLARAVAETLSGTAHATQS
jgi:hypothetical protein